MRHALPTLGLATLLAATPAIAGNTPGDVHLETYAGLYAPQASVVNELDSNIEATMAGALGFGAQMTIWLNSSVGLAASGYYVNSSLDATVFGESGSLDASVFLGGARVVVGIGGSEFGPSILNLSAGVVANQTDYGKALESNTHAAGVIGAKLNIPLGPSAGIQLGVDDYIYDKWFEVDGLQTESARQHDLVLFGGFTFFTGN